MILGLDLSSSNSGYALLSLEGDKLISYGSIIPGKKMSHCEKLMFIYDAIDNLFKEFDVKEVSIEDQLFRRNISTLKLLSRIGGVAMLCSTQHGASVFLYPATTIKHSFTGNGKADKEDMILKAKTLYKIDGIDDNIADAIGCCYTHSQLKGIIPNKKKSKQSGAIKVNTKEGSS